MLPPRPVYTGEVFDLGFAWQVDWALFRNLEGDLDWTPGPLAVEPWPAAPPPGRPEPAGTRQVATIAFATRAMALQPGRFALAAPRQRMSIVIGGYETDGVRIDTLGPVTAQGRTATLEVRALPPPPPGFAGAVGRFTLASAIDGKGGAAKVGEPLRWTLTLSGTGNWASFGGVPARPLSRDFDVVGQPEQGEDKDGTLFEQTRRETVTIVPRRAGHFTLGPVEMIVFDPAAGRYITVAASPLAIDVAPGAAGAAARYEAEPDPVPPGEPLPPPLDGVGAAWAPMTLGAWRAALALPVAALALLWLALATLRARAADPEREARRAHARLAATLAALGRAPSGDDRRRLVRAWQRDVVPRLKLPRAQPTPGHFADADWAALWSEAEAYLYGPARDLPGDWADRAAAALAARDRPPGFAPRTIFARRHLYPVAALLCLVAAGAGGRLVAAAPAPPGGWIAHYAAAREAGSAGRWTDAAADAAIAWMQAPRRAETRALWWRAAREAGIGGLAAGTPPLPDGVRGGWSALATPLVWQVAAIAGLWIAAAGAALVLLHRFGHAPRRLARVAGAAALLAGVAATGGGMGVGGYGAAAWRDAALLRGVAPLRPLPVDTPADEAPATLGPATVGHADRAFLGWVRLRLGDGRTGWVHRGALIPVWRPLP